MSLAPISIASPFCGVVLILYGWAFEKRLHWVLPIVGCMVVSWIGGIYDSDDTVFASCISHRNGRPRWCTCCFEVLVRGTATIVR